MEIVRNKRIRGVIISLAVIILFIVPIVISVMPKASATTGTWTEEHTVANGKYTITYSLDVKKEEAVIISSSDNTIDLTTSRLVIPNEITVTGNNEKGESLDGTYKVVGIGADAFSLDKEDKNSCVTVKEIVLGANVTEIGDNAFKGMTSLLSVNLEGVKKIGASAFEGTGIAVVRTGKELTYVGDKAFASCPSLLYFDIGFDMPKDKWGVDVFTGSGNVTYGVKLHIKDGLRGWTYCRGLSSIGFWTESADEAKWGFTDEIVLDYAGEKTDFENMDVTISDSNGLIYKLFRNSADGSDNYTRWAHVVGFDPNTIGSTLSIPKSVKWVDGSAEYTVAEIVTPLSQTEITNLESIYIGENIIYVDEEAFANIKSLTDIYIKSTETQIRTGGAVNSKGISGAWKDKRVVTNNAQGGLSQYDGKDHIFINHELDQTFFTDKQGVFYYVDLDGGFALVGDNANRNDTIANTSRYNGSDYYSGKANKVIIPDYVSVGDRYLKVIGIGRYAFYNSSALSEIELGAFIGEDAIDSTGGEVKGTVSDASLRNCQFLVGFSVDKRNRHYKTDNYGDILYQFKSINNVEAVNKIVKAGKNVTSFDSARGDFFKAPAVENYAFANCVDLTYFDLTFVTKIGEHAFNNTALTSISFGAEVFVGDYAFMNCYRLKTVYISANTTLRNFVFRNCYDLISFTSDSAQYRVGNDGALYEVLDGKTYAGGPDGKYARLMQYPAARAASTFTVDKAVFSDSSELNVRMIDPYAFAYSSISEITVGNNVDFIGKAAFENCSRLEKVTIGKNVNAIGIEIESYPADKEDGERTLYVDLLDTGAFSRNFYQIYEREVFDGCNLLSRIEVDGSNKYYHADSNGILYNKDKTVLLVYAPGITRLTYTVPGSVKEIGMEAFEDNVHLHRVSLPEGLLKVGAKAFNGCTKLSFIYFRSPMSPSVGDQAFNSCGVLAEGGFKIYCIPEPGVWYSNRAEIWEPYSSKVEKYVAIQAIPEQSLPTPEMYLIYVIDSDGNYLPGMILEYSYMGTNGTTITRSVVINEDGYAILTLPSDRNQLYGENQDKLTVTITDLNGIYYDFKQNRSFVLDLETGFSYVTLRSIPGLNGVTGGGLDIDTGFVSYNMINLKADDPETEGENEEEFFPLVVRTYRDVAARFVSLTLYAEYKFKDQSDFEKATVGVLSYDMTTNVYTMSFTGRDPVNYPASEFTFPENVAEYKQSKDGVVKVYVDTEGNPTGTVDVTFLVPSELSAGKLFGKQIGDGTDLEKYSYYAQLETVVKRDDDPEPKTIRTSVKLRADLYYFDFAHAEGFKSPLDCLLEDGKIKFNIGQDVPILGNLSTDLAIDLGMTDDNGDVDSDWDKAESILNLFELEAEGDKAVLIVNMKDWDILEDKDKYRNNNDFYLQIEKQVDQMLAEFSSSAAKPKPKQELTISLKGALEISKKSLTEGTRITRGYIAGYATYTLNIGKTVMLAWFPLRLELTLDVDGHIGLNLEIDDPQTVEDEGAHGIEFGVKVGVEGRAGAGCSVLSLGFYGNGSVDLLFHFLSTYGTLDADIALDFGLYAKVNMLFFKHTWHFSIVKLFGEDTAHWQFSDVPLYGEKPGVQPREALWAVKSRGRTMYFNTIEEAINYSILTTDVEFEPIEEGSGYESYGGKEPKIVENNGKLYKLYVDNLYFATEETHENIGTYDRYNYMKLVYEVYENGAWSKPRVLTEGSFNDIDFDVISDENGVHIAYTRIGKRLCENGKTNITVGEEYEAKEYAQHTENYIISIKDGVVGEAEKISTTPYFKSNITIFSNKGELTCAWTENSDYNVLGVSNDYQTDDEGNITGDILTTANSIVFVKSTENGFADPKSVSGLGVITDIEIVNAQIFAALDVDCNMATTQDRALVSIGTGDDTPSIKEYAINAESSELFITPPAVDGETATTSPITDIEYAGGILYAMADNSLFSLYIGASEVRGTLITENIAPSDIKLILNADGTVYGAAYTEDINEEIGEGDSKSFLSYSRLYVRLYIDGSFTEPVEILRSPDGLHIDYFEPYIMDGEFRFAIRYLEESEIEYTPEDDNCIKTYTHTDIVLEKAPDLKAEDVIKAKECITLGEEFEISVVVRNDSLKTLTSLTAALLAGNTEIASAAVTDIILLPGGSYEVKLSFKLIDLSEVSTEYSVKVSTSEYEDADISNNTLNGIRLAFPDLTVSAKYVVVGDIKYLLVLVQNNGTLSTSGYTIYVANGVLKEEGVVNNSLYSFHEDAAALTREEGDNGLSPGKYKYYTIELNKIYFSEIDFVSVSVVPDEDSIPEADLSNNTMSFSMEKNDAIDYGVSYRLEYYLNNQLISSLEYKAGETIDTSVYDIYEHLEGHTFYGWSGETDVMPAHDLKVYGYFVPNRYNVNYYVDGSLQYTDGVLYGTDVALRDGEIKEGHTFDGWYTDPECTDAYEPGRMPAGDLKLYGRFTRNTYKVYYYVDGKPYYPIDVRTDYLFGESITLAGYTAETGYTFSGWQLPEGITVMPAYNIHIYGSTSINKFKLIYMISTDGGEYKTVMSYDVQYGSIIPYYNYAVPSGYTFSGWRDEGGGFVTSTSNTVMPNSNLVLKGENSINTYTVSYYVNGGVVHSKNVVYGAAIPAYTYVSLGGLTVSEWTNLPSTMPASDISVYAAGSSVTFNIKYYIDGDCVYTDTYMAGERVELRVPESREGYSFSGWDNTASVIPGGLMPEANIQLYGTYKINTYKLYYYVDSVLYKEVSYRFGDTVETAAYTPKTGYSFSGFENVPSKMPASDVYVYGSTSVKSFVITYYVDGAPVNSYTLPFGAAIPSYTYEKLPEGHSIGAWSYIPTTMPAENVNVNATTTKNKYTITYYVDGQKAGSVVYTFGDAVSAIPYNPELGKTFSGFSGVPATMPSHDVNIYGTTSSISYKLDYYVDGVLMYTDVYKYDEKISVRPPVSRYGYTFSGWGSVGIRMPAHDVAVYATLERNTHKVDYYIGGALVHTDLYKFGDKVNAYNPETRTGYTFGGWSFVPSQMQDEDIIVSGSYVANKYTVSYYVNGEFYKGATLTYGSPVDLSLYEGEAYRIVGWRLNGNAVTSLTVPDSDIRLDAVTEEIAPPFIETKTFAVVAAAGGTLAVTGSTAAAIFFKLKGDLDVAKGKKLRKTKKKSSNYDDIDD